MANDDDTAGVERLDLTIGDDRLEVAHEAGAILQDLLDGAREVPGCVEDAIAIRLPVDEVCGRRLDLHQRSVAREDILHQEVHEAAAAVEDRLPTEVRLAL